MITRIGCSRAPKLFSIMSSIPASRTRWSSSTSDACGLMPSSPPSSADSGASLDFVATLKIDRAPTRIRARIAGDFSAIVPASVKSSRAWSRFVAIV
jgi:hypothetical protein